MPQVERSCIDWAQTPEEGHACMQQFLQDEGWACRLPGLVLANQVLLV